MDNKQVRERNAEESQGRLLRAAECIFASKGFDDARVDEIASRAQINKRMIYHYFGGKEGLYKEVLRVNYGKIMEVGNNVVSMDAGVVEKVAEFIRQYFYFLAGNEEFVRLLKWESLQEKQFSRPILSELSTTTLPKLAAILEDGVEQGVLRPDLNIRQLIISINAMCMMYFTRQDVYSALWQQDMSGRDTLQERLDHILGFTFNGILNHYK